MRLKISFTRGTKHFPLLGFRKQISPPGRTSSPRRGRAVCLAVPGGRSHCAANGTAPHPETCGVLEKHSATALHPFVHF